jgi:hypothetical protein
MKEKKRCNKGPFGSYGPPLSANIIATSNNNKKVLLYEHGYYS